MQVMCYNWYSLIQKGKKLLIAARAVATSKDLFNGEGDRTFDLHLCYKFFYPLLMLRGKLHYCDLLWICVNVQLVVVMEFGL